MSKSYLVFAYVLDGQQYVEAYPTRYPGITARFLPPDIDWTQITSKSRTQARRSAYRIFVRADGEGFNALPYRLYAREVRIDTTS